MMFFKIRHYRGLVILSALFILFLAASAQAQTKAVRLSIATGGTGGVYYPWGEEWPRSSPSISPMPRPQQR